MLPKQTPPLNTGTVYTLMMRTVGQNKIHLEVTCQVVIKVVLFINFKAEDFFKCYFVGKCLFLSLCLSLRSTDYSRFKRQGFHDQSLIPCTQQSGFEDRLLLRVKIRFYATWRIEGISTLSLLLQRRSISIVSHSLSFFFPSRS